MDSNTNRTINAISSALMDERYTLRTASGIAAKAGVSEEEVIAVAAEFGYSTGLRRRSDGAPLIGL